MTLSIRLLTVFTFIISYSPILTRAWRLVDTYNVDNWQQGMWLETRTTNAEYVTYLDKTPAMNSGLIRNVNGKLLLGVDSSTKLDPATGKGRNSVRLRTNKAYNAGTLVIGDFAHMPGNECGVWPSFWMVGPSWPADGEIDIIEGVNQMDHNQITIHTKPGCVPGTGPGGQSGQKGVGNDCGANGGDIGCGVNTVRPEAWGKAFNSAGGGVYAMMWTSTAIKIWHWKQNEVPGDARGNNPNPDGWGQPVANWNGCDFGKLMDNMNIVINTAFCGNWAGAEAVWNPSQCGKLANQCLYYVAANPGVYSEAYWAINSIKVFAQ